MTKLTTINQTGGITAHIVNIDGQRIVPVDLSEESEVYDPEPLTVREKWFAAGAVVAAFLCFGWLVYNVARAGL